MTRRQSFSLLLLLALAGCGDAPRERPGSPDGEAGARAAANGPVAPGIQVLLGDSLHIVKDRQVGLITNVTGVAEVWLPGGEREVRSSIDLLHEHPEVDLAALFAPEHGIRGRAEAGERVETERDARTGVTIHSLYGEVRKPTPAMLEGVEVLLFDIQDIGARYYTYVSTMALAMEAAGEAGIPFVVLDRPNPIGGVEVQGDVLDTGFRSFVGLFPVPMRHGMTPGELARLYRGAFEVEADLRVVPAEGWRREMYFDDTGLPWVAPSPNMPSLESALHYPGTCLFEGTELSVGRGTERPFQQVGAPWLDGEELARRLNGRGLPGVRFEAVRFTPRSPGDGKFAGEEVGGVRLVATDRTAYDPTVAAVAALLETRILSEGRMAWRPGHFDRLAGTDALRRGIDAERSLEELLEGWAGAAARFRELRAPYLIYPVGGGS